MPIYEFQCNDCKRDFEELVFGDNPPICIHCQSANTERRISMPRTHEKIISTGDSYRSGVRSSSLTGKR